ncbi:MAG: hypothetical protein OET44_18275 [Gammaproteobacteria bacterium]|nr:hypothetical protein [Gammaproteobacteria bacterium]
MQNTDAVIQQGLAFFQTGMGLAMLSLVALLLLVCVLLTVLVVSLGPTQRTLVASAETANKLLAQIRDSLAAADNPLPIRHRPVLNEPNLPPSRLADSPRRGDSVSRGIRPTRNPPADASSDKRKRRDPGEPVDRPARSARTDGKTDVYVSADAGNARVRPAADARTDVHQSADENHRDAAQPKRKARAGASTDVFKSIDI